VDHSGPGILLWWPLIAFVVAVLQPSAAAGVIAAAGAGLTVLGVLGAAVKSAPAGRIDSSGGAETARVLAVREGGTVGVRLAVWCLCWAGCAVV
jgi:hypothetical protein